MTNGETFFLVAFTMVLTLGPFAILIVSGLRHSKETHEILYKPKSFNNTWQQYFISLNIIFSCSLTILGSFLMKTTFTLQFNSSSAPDWVIFLLFSLALMLLAFAVYIFALIINHWKYTKDVMITFDPLTKTIFIESFCGDYELHEDDIEYVDAFSNQNPKILFLFYRIKIRDRPDLILTGNTRGVLGIFEFFKKIPIQFHKRRFPIIH